MKNLGVAIAVLLLLGAGHAHAATLTIDDFESPDPADVIIPGFTQENGKPFQHAGSALTVGGQRDVKIDVQGAPKPNSAQVLIGHDDQLFKQGVFQVATASSPGSIITLQYDGLDDNPTALTNAHGLSMAVAPAGGITIDFLSVDAPNAGLLDVSIRLYSNNAAATYHGLVPEAGDPQDMYAPFDEFDVGDGFAFDAIDSFEFVFNSSALVDVDFVVNKITTTVPEPGAFPLALFGVAVAMFVRRARP